MGLKDLVFVGLCLVGAAVVGGSLLKRERIVTPRDFQPNRFVTPAANAPRERVFPLPEDRPENDLLAAKNRIDAELAKQWQAKGLEPAGVVDDLQLARRLSLSLTGTIPSLEEIRSLEQVPVDQRREWWVSHLLEDRRFSDYFAERFARAFVGTEDGPFLIFRRRRFVAWLSDQFHTNQPYDQVVRALIAEKGLWTSSPAVNFVTVTANQARDNKPDEIRLAGRVSRAFLGIRIDCLQCHDDRLGNVLLEIDGETREGTQQHFHQLAAFFGRVENSLTGVREDGKRKYEYQYLNAKATEVVPPSVPFNQQCFSGHGELRDQLANWVTHPKNRPFARATVNRVWALLLGKPLVEPIDNIPLHDDLPPVLELLADDFIEHQFDLQRLIRLITASEAFRRASEADFDITPKHENAWAAFPLTRLRPEQVASSISQAAWLQTIDADAHVIQQLAKFGQTRDFVVRYGDLGQDEFNDRGGTITQRLLMMNGDIVKERIDENIVMNAATRLNVVCPDNQELVEAVYLTILTRRPSAAEKQHFVAALTAAGSPAKRRDAISDLYWILFNSTEFSWNH